MGEPKEKELILRQTYAWIGEEFIDVWILWYVSYLLGEVVHKTFRMETICFSRPTSLILASEFPIRKPVAYFCSNQAAYQRSHL